MPNFRSLKIIFSLTFGLCAAASAQDRLPVKEQNALVQKYCAVCHSDAARNGGLTLQHFDAAAVTPSLAAMMLSKLNSGALGASGQPVPEMQATDAALKEAFTQQSTGAEVWSVERTPVLTASILRVGPTAKEAAIPESYRLVLTCEGIQVAWSPVPQSGSLSASVDGAPAVRIPVQGSETMGNGSGQILSGRAAVNLSLPLPKESLTIRDLFPGHTVTFPFSTLPQSALREFAACLPPA